MKLYQAGATWIVAVALTLTMAGCTSAGTPVANLMKGVSPQAVPTQSVDDSFATGMTAFAASLLAGSATGTSNVLVSPLSAELALAMTANGAKGPTLQQMEQVLAAGLPIADINATLAGYVPALPNTAGAKFHSAQSLWCNSGHTVILEQQFLQTNANYYAAGLYSVPFGSPSAVTGINSWVSQNTDGMIQQMFNTLSPDAALLLLSALAFDATWSTPYEDASVRADVFTSADGRKQTAQYMASTEATYYDDGHATGFARPYDKGEYQFVALLPNPGVVMSDYLQALAGGGLRRTLAGGQRQEVIASLPQFSFPYSTHLVDILKAIGMTTAFTPGADFSQMGTMDGQPLFISDVQQNTYIDVTQRGTRAGSVTSVEMLAGAAPGVALPQVILDRPFVFAIVDAANHLPLFLGVVNSV